jgi:hypothetical protein
MKSIGHTLFVLLLVLLAGCEQPVITDTENTTVKKGNLTLSILEIEHTDFAALTRSAASDVCNHLNFAVYDAGGTRVKQTNQKLGDSDFGTVTFQLAEGTYTLVALAHSSNGNPTMTNPAKIQFNNSQGYTDTFLYTKRIVIGSEAQTLSLSLHRITALCRFIINDAIPEGVAKLEFTYKGGSGTFDASTGLGCVNSTQVMKYDVQTGKKQTQYDLYTFLHDTEGTLHLKVTAYDASGNILHEKNIDVEMHQDQITWLRGDFFSDANSTITQSFSATVNIDTQWQGELNLTY